MLGQAGLESTKQRTSKEGAGHNTATHPAPFAWRDIPRQPTLAGGELVCGVQQQGSQVGLRHVPWHHLRRVNGSLAMKETLGIPPKADCSLQGAHDEYHQHSRLLTCTLGERGPATEARRPGPGTLAAGCTTGAGTSPCPASPSNRFLQ